MPTINWDEIAPNRYPTVAMSPRPAFTWNASLSDPWGPSVGGGTIATVEELEECKKRYLGKLVRSNSESYEAIGIVERVITQAENLGEGSSTELVLMIRRDDGSVRSNWVKHAFIEVWGE